MNIEPGGETGGGRARDRFARMHDELRWRICLLDYGPGTRLSEEVLAAEFGVSRTPLRRVFARLEGEGLLQSVHGVGTFVTDSDVAQLGQTYRLRLELAVLTGQLDTLPPSAILLDRLRACLPRALALRDAPEPRAFAELNMDFFLARLQLTGNAPLREISERLYLRTTRIWLKTVFASRIDLQAEVTVFVREIEDVLLALEVGDLPAAALIQRAHISLSFARMRRAT